jgi:hypothetical protein
LSSDSGMSGTKHRPLPYPYKGIVREISESQRVSRSISGRVDLYKYTAYHRESFPEHSLVDLP